MRRKSKAKTCQEVNGVSADEVVRNFQGFIVSSWPKLSVLLHLSSHGVSGLDDWLQANWEILVEATLCTTPSEFLEAYGEGADCNGHSSRVWMPEAVPTHEIVCKAQTNGIVENKLNGDSIDPQEWQFTKFVCFKNGKYDQAPPLKHVLLEREDQIAVVCLGNVFFESRSLR